MDWFIMNILEKIMFVYKNILIEHHLVPLTRDTLKVPEFWMIYFIFIISIYIRQWQTHFILG